LDKVVRQHVERNRKSAGQLLDHERTHAERRRRTEPIATARSTQELGQRLQVRRIRRVRIDLHQVMTAERRDDLAVAAREKAHQLSAVALQNDHVVADETDASALFVRELVGAVCVRLTRAARYTRSAESYLAGDACRR